MSETGSTITPFCGDVGIAAVRTSSGWPGIGGGGDTSVGGSVTTAQPGIAPGPVRASDVMHTGLLSVNVPPWQRRVQAGVCSAEVKANASACTTNAFVMQAQAEQQACASCKSLPHYHKWSELYANPAQCCCSLWCAQSSEHSANTISRA